MTHVFPTKAGRVAASGNSDATDYRGHAWRDSVAPDEVIWWWWRGGGDRKTGRQRGKGTTAADPACVHVGRCCHFSEGQVSVPERERGDTDTFSS